MRNLLQKPKKDHFAKFDTFSATDNKGFWQTVKFLFPVKVKSHKIVDLAKKDKLIDEEEEIAKVSNKFIILYFNLYFTQNLCIETKKSNTKLTDLQLDEVNMTIANNIHHTSLKAIQNRMEELNNPTFNI